MIPFGRARAPLSCRYDDGTESRQNLYTFVIFGIFNFAFAVWAHTVYENRLTCPPIRTAAAAARALHTEEKLLLWNIL